MASFLVKLDMDRPKKRRRKKNCYEYHFWLLKLEHSQKNSKKVVKKFKKLKKYHSSFISNQTRPTQARKRDRKIFVPSIVST